MKDKSIFLRSGKCGWGKCIFCGWGKYEYSKMTLHELKKKIDKDLEKRVDILKIFNSGSFLDEDQIPKAFRSYLVRKCELMGVKKLFIESRTEYVDESLVEDMKSDKVKVIIGIGLEVADDEILKKLDKGLTVEKYVKAAGFLRKNGFGVRSYVLVNAPYTNQKTLDRTVELAKKYSDYVCLLNWSPHGYSEAFDLWINGKWKPFTEKQFNDATKNYKGKNIEKYSDEFSFVPRIPPKKQEWLRGATEKVLLHPYFRVWQEYFVEGYVPPKTKKILLFIPCSFRKPYNLSHLHKSIFSVLYKMKMYDKIHVCVVSTPGVVPYSFIKQYPFTKYDWPEWEETPKIKKKYIEVTQKRVEDYLRAHGSNYKKFYNYFKLDSETYIALHNVCTKLGIGLIDCLTKEAYEKVKGEKNPLSLEEALKDLKSTLNS